MANQKTTMSEESKNDVVKEARELLETHSIVAMRVDRPYKEIRPLISALCDQVEDLKGRNSTQEESITHMQSQLRVMKEAIEFLVSAAEFSLSTPGMIRGRDQLKNAKEQGRSAITPKGAV